MPEPAPGHPVSYRLQSIKTVKSGINRQWIEYAYDNNGNLADITDVLDPNKSGHYIYHYMDLLSTAQVKDPAGNAVNISMAYSRTGNIASNSRLGAYTYSSSRPYAVRAAGANTYNYDANGNMTSRVTGARNQSMVFDYENRLASITEGANRNDYLYDYTGARVKKGSLVSGVTSTTVYIGGIYEQKDGVNIKHIFAGSRRVASRKGTVTFYFHPDHLGSLSVVTNSAQVDTFLQIISAGKRVMQPLLYFFGECMDAYTRLPPAFMNCAFNHFRRNRDLRNFIGLLGAPPDEGHLRRRFPVVNDEINRFLAGISNKTIFAGPPRPPFEKGLDGNLRSHFPIYDIEYFPVALQFIQSPHQPLPNKHSTDAAFDADSSVLPWMRNINTSSSLCSG